MKPEISRTSGILVLSMLLALSTSMMPLAAQSSDSGLGAFVQAGLHVPTVPYLREGITARTGIDYQLSGAPLFIQGELGYHRTSSTTDLPNATLDILTISAGPGVRLSLFQKLKFRAALSIGYGQGFYSFQDQPSNGGALYWGVDAGFRFHLNDRLSLDLRTDLFAQMNTHFALEVTTGVAYNLGGSSGTGDIRNRESSPEIQPLENSSSAVEISGPGEVMGLYLASTVSYDRADLQLDQAGFVTVFPVFYRYYDSNPTGAGIFRNGGKKDIRDIELTVNIPAFMDLPQSQSIEGVLSPGEELPFGINVLFNNQLLTVTEGTKVAAQITVKYSEGGIPRSYSIDTSLTVADRNAITWDDDRKAAAFVTAKDPSVLTFAKKAAGISRNTGAKNIIPNLKTAMALLETMNLYGLDYVVDPTTPYTETSESARTIDFLQFPVQTFQYSAGDCDDLSICYSSLLQSVGVPAAFVTVPGHIFVAFNTGVPESQAKVMFSDQSRLIYARGDTWIPVEVTALDQGFLKAWELGARLWAQYSAAGDAAFYPVSEAWEVYAPVGFDLNRNFQLTMPSDTAITEAFLSQLNSYVESSLATEVKRIEDRIKTRGASAAAYNSLAIIYAKYGVTDKARDYLNQALAISPTPSIYINLGNIEYLDGDYETAMNNYQRAANLNPADARVKLALARVNHELGNYQVARAYYNQVEVEAPEMAAGFAYLGAGEAGAGRASDSGTGSQFMLWATDEEEQ